MMFKIDFQTASMKKLNCLMIAASSITKEFLNVSSGHITVTGFPKVIGLAEY